MNNLEVNNFDKSYLLDNFQTFRIVQLKLVFIHGLSQKLANYDVMQIFI